MPRVQQKKVQPTATKSVPDHVTDQFGADDDVTGDSQHSSLNGNIVHEFKTLLPSKAI